MIKIGLSTIMMVLATCFASLQAQNENTIHQFTVKDINGEDFILSQLKGKKVLIVNTASKCGMTPQYEDLEKLYQTYKEQDFVVVGFPANDFMNQEPGTNEEIKQFCQQNYGVTFPMMSKISVKGDDMSPVYQWLTSAEKNGKMDSKVKWNFQKYLIDEQGQLVDVFDPKTEPMNDKIVQWIESSN